MKAKEKKLIALAVVMILAVVIVRGIPMLLQSYQDMQDEIEFTQDQIQRLRLLFEEGPFLIDEEALKREEMAALESWVFTGQDQNLIGSGVQRSLRQVVEEAGVLPRSYSTPRYNELDGWLIVSQEMDFAIDQEKILPFLDKLRQSRPRLHVTEFSINRNRRQFLGAITVTGFSKIP
jgi:hypothetical protein